MRAESKRHIQAAIDAIPGLNDYGIGLYSSDQEKPLSEQEEIKASNVERLLNSTEEFEKACTWIRENLTATNSFNSKRSSYGLKHIAEIEIEYITNGVFIAAMQHCGYKVRVIAPNAVFNVSEKSVEIAAKRVYH